MIASAYNYAGLGLYHVICRSLDEVIQGELRCPLLSCLPDDLEQPGSYHRLFTRSRRTARTAPYRLSSGFLTQ